jgi:primosomal protein N' (replication factor Y)
VGSTGKQKATLALVSRVHSEVPSFAVKSAVAHASFYVFDERYLEILEWTAHYYLSTVNKALFVFWPAEIAKFLDVFLVRKNSIFPAEAPSEWEPPAQPPLTEEQSGALDKLIPLLGLQGFRGAWLHGVTGSGKTRVYLELSQRAIEQGKRVLILVPEIGLTPQTAARFSAFLGFPVPVLHSALSAPRKREIWVSILENRVRVMLGTRSAILTPFHFDLVILDEEHDSSYKQQDPSPRYHCRELAFHAAHKYGALVVLGSATPSMESFENARRGICCI